MKYKIVLIIVPLVSGIIFIFFLPTLISRGVGYNKNVYDGIDIFFAWVENVIMITFFFLTIFGPLIYLFVKSKKII
ncbi:MAG: hypothetical protein A3I29_02035 [Candidatus Magasanikbacteria bacterium RIFCSPLOWO2_02_FULL_44_11]|uniref:DUF5671 domain-containing protein n=2 Tax=Candidatus Magasanikiibacteriota TaxID=1752731 RepID=A0A1F6NA68_9BACT|nr:MAG: hypothetical protein A3D53_03395 [Candidatus Magasanikbacteria bacterium RIFCSPHIGHO2_02_FULL_45_10]OGH80824.1 MAG: hypothetical protein A3I29_02035 [Candidatus Magasanikbacteria bacterium RIFCSPLOWO2_02_FULL_44_11]